LTVGFEKLFEKQYETIPCDYRWRSRRFDSRLFTSGEISNIPIDKDRIVFENVFRTPLFDFNSCSTTPELPALNGINDNYYCGSHFGFGVHEDAVTSAIAVAEKLNVSF
jgi:predicted NAD/FAD-binding protein